jgi:hypothetical protein
MELFAFQRSVISKKLLHKGMLEQAVRISKQDLESRDI